MNKNEKSEPLVHEDLPWTILDQIFRPLRRVYYPIHRTKTHTQIDKHLSYVS